ncbi:YceD family protein [Parablautia muri]|uniref:DUF177 domain-containing protein n=1 Tax=Parablautia muri TaxID=2320879 RepID=A0A9X5GQ43_9FIRM|nr:DUF177 domain-containing protein [Parablautia muri]NBJ91583.1 DUF177 domain-containing protein [Parablautia muri]
MLINLADVFTSEGKDRRESVAFEPDRISHMGNSYKIREKSPVDLTFTNIGRGKILIRGEMRLVLEIPCDRCLEVVYTPLELRFEQEIFAPDLDGHSLSQDEQQDFMAGYELNVEAFVNGEILINMPVKVLCKPDCKGICKQCGHNLNEGECGCDTFVPDPRMAAIQDIFNAGKEV